MKSLRSFILVAFSLALMLSLDASRTVSALDIGSIDKTFYGKTTSDVSIEQYTLTNAKGMEVKIITYGGIVTSVRNNKRGIPNVVLGFNNLHDYETLNSPHFGAIIGRYANRIANGVFTLDGVTYCLDANNGVNSLHGGFKGFDTKVWTVTKLIYTPNGVGIELNYLSPAGDGWSNTAPNPNCPEDSVKGFPGDLDTYVTYILNNQNQLVIRYLATTDADTVVNLTNHSYWNLAGEGTGTIYSNWVTINADRFTPVNSVQIPTGATPLVFGTVFNFLHLKPVSRDIRFHDQQLAYGNGFDHNWIVNRSKNQDQLTWAAAVREPYYGRTLNVWTNQPGIQFYTGNSLDGSLYGTSNREYRQSDGLALETQHYPNSPNEPKFPSTVLHPDQTYDTTTVFEIQN
jgi:aldose 1-epimerase